MQPADLRHVPARHIGRFCKLKGQEVSATTRNARLAAQSMAAIRSIIKSP